VRGGVVVGVCEALCAANEASDDRSGGVVRRWFTRSLWLAAWSFWLWLGFGLYRELPRELGPVACRAPVQQSEFPLGFVKDRPLVVIQPRFNPKDPIFKVFDANSGAFVHDIAFEGRVPHSRTHLCRSHGVLLALGDGVKNRGGLHVVEVATGGWKTLSERFVIDVDIDIHPARPWVAFRESAKPIDSPRPLVVIDWSTGSEVFARPKDRGRVSTPVFMGNSDRLVVEVTGADEAAAKRTDVEVWLLGSPSRLEKVIKNCGLGNWRQATSASRIARCNMDDSHWNLEVFDIDVERVVFSTPPKERMRMKPSNYLFGPPVGSFRLATSGKSLTCEPLTCVWDVNAGAERWRLPRGWRMRPAEGRDLFFVEERWDPFWGLVRWERFGTTAVRDIDSAALKFRCWNYDAGWLSDISADGKLAILQDGAIRRPPFQINWSLLAFSQTILALPLVLLWATLRWRRKRTMRMAGMQP
jgi:hypothetical protein